ncbi:hypothetical protein XENTR_v10012382 [Xenopus tropicalis]|uniref:G protein-coupled receptor, class C, group 5, member A n=1 Tax=Xenopus tropicalis TaxID=8364 RepID=F7DX22_XENTR|nr:G-protein coupled receptor family C group 5 member D [Xenopus tropicalis]KAE8611244.1 hypothetical protein XENTR_v10012382 [Xenopus tropicalis]KAE8611245.1 hypothetical protein XENTR_v10012382 [Xenopus tropicalis]|eukprot:XP_002934774.1 PREDICTED: G-protein coupled receptor family C group 5 member D [Xenopus tropicalis]
MSTTTTSTCVARPFSYLCDTNAAWGIVLETLAAAGIVFSIVLMLALLIMVPRIGDYAKRAVVPVQFIFLVATFGIFGLTFAFIVELTDQTCPTRFFLFGVLFAICFSCLLAHASKLVKLVRGGLGICWWVMLIMVLFLSLVQVVIAILYIVLSLVRGATPCSVFNTNTNYQQINQDFVLVLIYVYLLMAITLIVSVISLCGPCKYWKRHGAHIYVTMFLSVGIWVAWICMLLRGNVELNQGNHNWDDPVLAIALVANGWVFLMMYIVPELCLMTRCQPDTQKDCVQTQPRLLRQTIGVDNRVFTHENINQGQDSGRCSPVSSQNDATIAMRDLEQIKDFSIPRPQQRQNPYMQYRSHDLTSM